MSDLGQILNSHTIRFERLLPGPIERVWHYITSPEGIAEWLYAEAIVEQRSGGRIVLKFAEKDPESRHLYKVRGIVSECVAPKLIAYTWFETSVDLTSKVRFELEERGDQVALTITHSYICAEFMPKVGAGWHSHLEALAAVLRGEKPGDFMPLYEQLFKTYSAALAAGIIVSATISPAIASPTDPAYRVLKDQRQELLRQYDKLWKEADEIKSEIDQLKRDTHQDTTRAQNDLEHELQYKNDDLHRVELDVHNLDKSMI